MTTMILQGRQMGEDYGVPTRMRLERARAEGEIPQGVDTRSLARFYATVIHGMYVQSRDGAFADDLAASFRIARLGSFIIA